MAEPTLAEVEAELARMEAWAAEQFMVLPESKEGQYIAALRRAKKRLDPAMRSVLLSAEDVADLLNAIAVCHDEGQGFVSRAVLEQLDPERKLTHLWLWQDELDGRGQHHREQFG